MVGVIIAVGSIASIIMPFLASVITAKTGNDKLMMFTGIVVSAVSIAPAILGFPVWVTLVTFFICLGMNWTTLSLADGYINKCINNDNTKYGLIRGLGTLGYVIFMTMFSITGFPDETNNYQVWMNIGLCSGLFLLVLCFCPDTRKLPQQQTGNTTKTEGKWYDRSFVLFLITLAFSRIPMAVFDKLLPSYMTEVLGLGKWFTAFTALGAFAEFLVLVFGARIADRKHIKPTTLFTLSCIGIIIRLILYIVSKNIYVFAIAQTMHALCFGCCHLAANSYLTHHVDSGNISQAFSVYWSLGTNLPQLLGTLMGGFIIDNLGYNLLFGINISFAAISLLFLAIFGKRYFR